MSLLGAIGKITGLGTTESKGASSSVEDSTKKSTAVKDELSTVLSSIFGSDVANTISNAVSNAITSSQGSEASQSQQVQQTAGNVAANTANTQVTEGGNVIQNQSQTNSGQVATQTYGTQQTVGGGQSQSTSVDVAGIQGIINDVIGRFQGLSAISSGAKSAGIYDSTTQQSQTNDLLAQLGGKLGQLNSTTTSKNLDQTIIRGPDVQTTGPTTTASSNSVINTPKIVSDAGLSQQLSNTNASTVANVATQTTNQQAQQSTTQNTELQNKQTSQLTDTTNTDSTKLTEDDILHSTSKGKTSGSGFDSSKGIGDVAKIGAMFG